jgi:hypothetical protein
MEDLGLLAMSLTKLVKRGKSIFRPSLKLSPREATAVPVTAAITEQSISASAENLSVIIEVRLHMAVLLAAVYYVMSIGKSCELWASE